MAEENSGQTTKIRLDMRAEIWGVYETQHGVVAIYRVVPVPPNEDSEYYIEPFYLVTYDNGLSEVAWGTGVVPWAALEYAAVVWDHFSTPDDKPNPFKQVLESTQPF